MPLRKVALAVVGLSAVLLLIYSIFNSLYKPAVLGQSAKNNSKSPEFTVVFLGDSMTEYLGNFDELRTDLNKYYPSKKFLLLNYGFGSTNILSVPDRLTKASDRNGRLYQPINDIPFDLIIIESFGYNPPSEYSLKEGQKKQIETLDQMISILTQKHPKSSIVFLATIAPNKDWFGTGVLNLQPDQKEKWVSERVSYIKNHIDYAKSHQIPLINVYEKSLDQSGNGNIDYINSNDFIHPSPTGIYFISQEIADFIQNHKLIE